MVEYLPSTPETLGSIPSSKRKKASEREHLRPRCQSEALDPGAKEAVWCIWAPGMQAALLHFSSKTCVFLGQGIH